MIIQNIENKCSAKDVEGFYSGEQFIFHRDEKFGTAIVIVYDKKIVEDLFKELKKIIPIFNAKVKERLEKDINLLFTTYKLVVELNKNKPKNLLILEIQPGRDPEIPDWQSIEILVTLKSKNYKYVFDTLRRLINDAYKDFNPDDVKDIDIIDVPYIRRT